VTVIDEIAAERRRQIEVEGWTAKHDDMHWLGHLGFAGACYAHHASKDDWQREPRQVPRDWPFAPEWWKPTTPRRDLIKAAALIVAEIERLDRRQQPPDAA
jgi:hypothetical protein